MRTAKTLTLRAKFAFWECFDCPWSRNTLILDIRERWWNRDPKHQTHWFELFCAALAFIISVLIRKIFVLLISYEGVIPAGWVWCAWLRRCHNQCLAEGFSAPVEKSRLELLLWGSNTAFSFAAWWVLREKKLLLPVLGGDLGLQGEFSVLFWLWFGAFAQSGAQRGGKPWTEGRDVAGKCKMFPPFHILSLFLQEVK